MDKIPTTTCQQQHANNINCFLRFQLVVANILETRKKYVVMVTHESEQTVKMADEELSRGQEIEAKIVEEVVKRHRMFIERQAETGSF